MSLTFTTQHLAADYDSSLALQGMRRVHCCTSVPMEAGGAGSMFPAL